MSHFLHFVRHGHYTPKEGTLGGVLTALGRRQSRRTAVRLSGCDIAKVYSSDLQRSQETADIIAEKLGGVTVKTLSALREIVPTGVPGHHVSLAKCKQGKEQIDKTVQQFFSEPPISGDVVVVCHGNLIRAVTCRILGTSPSMWHQLGTLHCGITTFHFGDNREIRVQCFNDTGHLAPELITSS